MGMPRIEFDDGIVQIDASLIAEGLGIEPSRLQAAIRERRITSRYERGIDQDAGRHRLTFISERRRLSFILDDAGNVVRRSVIDFGDRPGTPGPRRAIPRGNLKAEGEE
jgi:hypothetical protein